MVKWNSRKLIVVGVTNLVLCVLPVVFKSYLISDQITLMVLGSLVASAAAYLGVNVWQKVSGE